MNISERHIKDVIDYVVNSFSRYASETDSVEKLEREYSLQLGKLEGMNLLIPIGRFTVHIQTAEIKLLAIHDNALTALTLSAVVPAPLPIVPPK
ncbi:hypothetical protein [Methylomonas sp. HYX-M1]|uniref:hypothetical protein n=1 Tax=Methylomonas sp. HYX-M1 TaxID=3139307 RepID=UPI00345C1F54